MTEQEFIQELSKINITPTELQLKQLEKYYELLIEWNKVMNLTGITEKDQTLVPLKPFRFWPHRFSGQPPPQPPVRGSCRQGVTLCRRRRDTIVLRRSQGADA